MVVLTGITKRFPGVVANSDVHVTVRRGEVHAICGENGAGKSTLMKILYGMQSPDEGTIEVNGAAVRFRSPADAIRAGIGMVHQHFMLADNLTVLENVAMPLFKVAQVDAREAKSITEMILDLVGISELVELPASTLSPLQQHFTALARAVVHNPRLLIIEELGSGLDPEAALRVFDVARRIPERLGTTVIATLSAGIDFASGDVVLEIGAAGIREVRKEPRT